MSLADDNYWFNTEIAGDRIRFNLEGTFNHENNIETLQLSANGFFFVLLVITLGKTFCLKSFV